MLQILVLPPDPLVEFFLLLILTIKLFALYFFDFCSLECRTSSSATDRQKCQLRALHWHKESSPLPLSYLFSIFFLFFSLFFYCFIQSDGQQCRQPIDTRNGPYCLFHVRSANTKTAYVTFFHCFSVHFSILFFGNKLCFRSLFFFFFFSLKNRLHHFVSQVSPEVLQAQRNRNTFLEKLQTEGGWVEKKAPTEPQEAPKRSQFVG